MTGPGASLRGTLSGMLIPVALSALGGFAVCRATEGGTTRGTVSDWSWRWVRLPEMVGGRALGTVTFSRPGSELTPPTRVTRAAAEGFAIGFLTGGDHL